MSAIHSSESELRLKFFDSLFGEDTGYICIGTKTPSLPHGGFAQKFFFWPDDYQKVEDYILRQKKSKDVYFCVNLLEKPERKKEYCLPTSLVWADLDETPPQGLVPQPSVVLETSKGRYQALWRLTMKIDPVLAENYSRRVAYKYGADKSGWDLTQLLRVPFTYNFKHSPPQLITVMAMGETKAVPLLFESLPAVSTETEIDVDITDVPTETPSVPEIFYKYAAQLRIGNFHAIYSQEISPEDDWSKPLWKLIHVCLEAGMSEEETFAVVKSSSVNKYDRDQRPLSHLWRDVLKAKKSQEELTFFSVNFKPVTMPHILDLDHEPENSFITEYRSWAEEATDAVPQFHDLSAFILLSSVVANSVRLDTSYGTMVPNLWGMILGDSTLSRKTTAMRMVMDMLNTMNQDMILATDGSAEGILSGLELRPNRTSIFFRDELSGFFDAINRKDYLAGIPEIFTALYDVPSIMQRRLRKEVIRLENPIFIFFGGGVRDKVYEVCQENFVISGFLPRFLVVAGDTDLAKLRRTGPATDVGLESRAKLVTQLADLYEKYAQEVIISIGGQKVSLPPRITAKLTPSAWQLYGDIEEKMVVAGSESSIPHMALPTFERLSRSLLKMSTILAADRQDPKDSNITVEDRDIKDAAWYVQQWGSYSIELITNTGKGTTERILDKIVNSIKKNPGVLRSTIMQHHHLTKREADEILNTLKDRMIIQEETRGRGKAYWAI